MSTAQPGSAATAAGRAAGAVLDTAAIRARFPALARTHAGQPVAFFDGPGGTQVPAEVPAAMTEYLLHHNANTHWHYPTSAETDALLLQARQAMADFLNADAAEIAFGQNMTSLTFHLARALARRWGPGDEIVITELDHHANQAPWTAVAQERGLTVRQARVRLETGQLDWDSLAECITPRTRLVAVGAGSNALGTITDVARAVRLAHDAGALCFVDAVHYAPHALVDVRAMDCDFLGCSSYKFYGPHQGILYGKRQLIEALDVPKLRPAPDNSPDRLETGTQSHEGIVGAMAAVDFLASLAPGATRRQRLATAFDALHDRGMALFASMWDGLQAIPGVTVYGPAPDQPRTPTIAFTVRGHASVAVVEQLVGHGVFATHGDFYATTVVERLGLQDQGLVRAGCACYTTPEEVARLVAGVAALAR